MRLTRVEARDFRCLEHIDLRPGPNINIVRGSNASGKTSILEAIFMLGRGQTFRSTALAPLVRRGQDGLTLAGWIEDQNGRSRRIGVVRHHGTLQYKLDHQAATRRFDLVSALPLQLIDPNLHRLLEQGPRYRRRFLDWGVFHVEHSFFQAWRTFRRALRQRNSALRRRADVATVTAWDAELVKAGTVIDNCRRRYVTSLSALLPATIVRVLAQDAPTMEYHPGWNETAGLAGALQASLGRDRRAGYTHVGPHRADLRLRVNGVGAYAHVSRGQQKMFAAAMLLAQVGLLTEHAGVRPVLLVDDVAAELGAAYLATLFTELERLDVQCFVTALDTAELPQLSKEPTVFHVEQGGIIGL